MQPTQYIGASGTGVGAGGVGNRTVAGWWRPPTPSQHPPPAAAATAAALVRISGDTAWLPRAAVDIFASQELLGRGGGDALKAVDAGPACWGAKPSHHIIRTIPAVGEGFGVGGSAASSGQVPLRQNQYSSAGGPPLHQPSQRVPAQTHAVSPSSHNAPSHVNSLTHAPMTMQTLQSGPATGALATTVPAQVPPGSSPASHPDMSAQPMQHVSGTIHMPNSMVYTVTSGNTTPQPTPGQHQQQYYNANSTSHPPHGFTNVQHPQRSVIMPGSAHMMTNQQGQAAPYVMLPQPYNSIYQMSSGVNTSAESRRGSGICTTRENNSQSHWSAPTALVVVGDRPTQVLYQNIPGHGPGTPQMQYGTPQPVSAGQQNQFPVYPIPSKYFTSQIKPHSSVGPNKRISRAVAIIDPVTSQPIDMTDVSSQKHSSNVAAHSTNVTNDSNEAAMQGKSEDLPNQFARNVMRLKFNDPTAPEIDDTVNDRTNLESEPACISELDTRDDSSLSSNYEDVKALDPMENGGMKDAEEDDGVPSSAPSPHVVEKSPTPVPPQPEMDSESSLAEDSAESLPEPVEKTIRVPCDVPHHAEVEGSTCDDGASIPPLIPPQASCPPIVTSSSSEMYSDPVIESPTVTQLEPTYSTRSSVSQDSSRHSSPKPAPDDAAVASDVPEETVDSPAPHCDQPPETPSIPEPLSADCSGVGKRHGSQAVPQSPQLVEGGSHDEMPSETMEPSSEMCDPNSEEPSLDQAISAEGGRLQYDRAFLISLQNHPLCTQKPDLPDLNIVRDKCNAITPGKLIRSGTDFTPDYIRSNCSGKSYASGMKPPSRTSQQGNRRARIVIDFQPTSSSDIKLKTAGENAWKPAHKTAEEINQLDTLKKKVRGILNKLTPENFDKLKSDFLSLDITTEDGLTAVIDLIFEKAVDEQSFAPTYAKLVSAMSNNKEKPIKVGTLDFRKQIIRKCQNEFMKDKYTEDNFKKMQDEYNSLTDSVKKQELKEELEYEEAKIRKRSVGNVKFIGELFGAKVLQVNIMSLIIKTLMDHGGDENLECLCKLLTTIGASLEEQLNTDSSKTEFDKSMATMKSIIESRRTSSRVRFLMMDVVDLQKNHWVPRREVAKPKTKAEIQQDVKREEYEQMKNLKEDRDRDRRKNRDVRAFPPPDDGWVTASRSSRAWDTVRLKNLASKNEPISVENVSFRGSILTNWCHGSSGGGGVVREDESKTSHYNRFSLLTGVDTGDKRGPVPNDISNTRFAPGGSSRQGSSYGSKSMEKQNTINAVSKFFDGASRSASTSRDNSSTREKDADSSAPNSSQRNVMPLSEDVAKTRSLCAVQEFINYPNEESMILNVHDKFSSSNIHLLVNNISSWVIDRNFEERKCSGKMLQVLLSKSVISPKQFTDGLSDIFRNVEDLCLDAPQVTSYIGELLGQSMAETPLPMKLFYDLACLAERKKGEVMASIVRNAATYVPPAVLVQRWHSQGLTWKSLLDDFVDVKKFLTSKKIEFFLDQSVSLDTDVIHSKLISLFRSSSEEAVTQWIDENVSSEVRKSKKFIRALVTSLIDSLLIFGASGDSCSVRLPDNFEDILSEKLTPVQKLVENEESELQCLYALQALSDCYEHPSHLFCSSIKVFYDRDVVSEDSVMRWVGSSDPEEVKGKAVCVRSSNTFLDWLKNETADTEDSTAQAHAHF